VEFRLGQGGDERIEICHGAFLAGDPPFFQALFLGSHSPTGLL